jgi:basic membrane protein A
VSSFTLIRALPLLLALGVLAAAAPTAGAAAPFRIGMVADTNGVFDRSFNQFAYAGVSTAALRLGSSISVLASPSVAAYEPNLRALAQQGYSLVIAIGPSEEQALADVARAYPSVQFAIVDDSSASGPLVGLPNVQGLLFKEQEAGYLAGYLAGRVELSAMPRLKPGNVVSTIAGTRDPVALRYLAGFQAGVTAADPRVRLLQSFVNAAGGPARCHTVAASQIAAGSDIIFPVAGGCNAGVWQAVNERGVWGIGVEADQSYLGAGELASAALHADQAVILAIDAAHAGTFVGRRDIEFGVAQGAVGIAGVNAAVPSSIRARLNAVLKRVRAGKIIIPTALAPSS